MADHFLILFSESARFLKVFKMVCFAFLARLDPAQSRLNRLKIAVTSRNSADLLKVLVRDSLNSTKSPQLSAYFVQDLDVLQ